MVGFVLSIVVGSPIDIVVKNETGTAKTETSFRDCTIQEFVEVSFDIEIVVQLVLELWADWFQLARHSEQMMDSRSFWRQA